MTLAEVEMLEKEAGVFDSAVRGIRGARRGFRDLGNKIGDKFGDAVNSIARKREGLRHGVAPASFSENIKHTRNRAAQALKEQRQRMSRFRRDTGNNIRDRVEDLNIGYKAHKASLDTSRFINNTSDRLRRFGSNTRQAVGGAANRVSQRVRGVADRVSQRAGDFRSAVGNGMREGFDAFKSRPGSLGSAFRSGKRGYYRTRSNQARARYSQWARKQHF